MNPLAQQPNWAAKHVLVSANPRSGSAPAHHRVERIEEALASAGYQVRVVTDLQQVADVSAEWQADGRLRAVLTAGGDGTAAGVLNRVPSDVPLVPLPLGTANLLARYMGQSAEPSDVLHTLLDGVVVRLDAGRANGRLFLLMISAGFDAEVVRHMHARRTGHITKGAYIKPIAQTIRSYEFPELRLYSQSANGAGQDATSCRWLFGFNLPRYALGLQFVPEAVGTDGMLDVCTFERGSVWDGLRYLWHVIRGKHVGLSDVAIVRSDRFRIEAADGSQVTYQIDGDTGGVLPVEVEVVPSRVSLLVSRETAKRLGFRLPA